MLALLAGGLAEKAALVIAGAALAVGIFYYVYTQGQMSEAAAVDADAVHTLEQDAHTRDEIDDEVLGAGRDGDLDDELLQYSRD